MRGEHLANADQPFQPVIPGRALARLIARALRRVDDPEPAIQPSCLHAREIHLRQLAFVAMVVGNAPSRPSQVRRRIQMGIEHQRTLMYARRFRSGVLRCDVSACQYRQRGGQGQQSPLHASPL